MKYQIAALSIALFLTGPALGQESRYTLEKTDDGFVRMDVETGAMSVCTMTNEQLICRMATDDREAYNADIAALEDRIAALEDQMGGAVSQDALPNEEEFERTLGYMERFMRRFMGVVEDFSNDSETQNEPAPDRT